MQRACSLLMGKEHPSRIRLYTTIVKKEKAKGVGNSSSLRTTTMTKMTKRKHLQNQRRPLWNQMKNLRKNQRKNPRQKLPQHPRIPKKRNPRRRTAMETMIGKPMILQVMNGTKIPTTKASSTNWKSGCKRLQSKMKMRLRI